MKRARALSVVIAFQALLVHAWAAEPLVGIWHLERQELNGEKTDAQPLILRISQEGDGLTFAFSLPVNQVYIIGTSYTVRLDGTAADIKNAKGEKIGTIKMTVDGVSQYKFIMEGPNRPESSGKLTVSSDGKTLTSESETAQAGRSVHSKQLFSRYQPPVR